MILFIAFFLFDHRVLEAAHLYLCHFPIHGFFQFLHTFSACVSLRFVYQQKPSYIPWSWPSWPHPCPYRHSFSSLDLTGSHQSCGRFACNTNTSNIFLGFSTDLRFPPHRCQHLHYTHALRTCSPAIPSLSFHNTTTFKSHHWTRICVFDISKQNCLFHCTLCCSWRTYYYLQSVYLYFSLSF